MHRSNRLVSNAIVTAHSVPVLNSGTTIHGTISRFHNALAQFWLSFIFFRAVTMQCITQAGTNLKAGQSCGPEKVCFQPSICSGVSRDA